MKKLTSIILSLVLLLGVLLPCGVSADAIQPLTKIGEIEVDEKAGYTLEFIYEGKEYSVDYTEMAEKDLEFVLEVFSDDNLVFCEKQDDYVPEGGCFDPVSKEDNVNYFFVFDEKKVRVTAVYPYEDGYYEGLFEYRDEKVYDELIEYLYALVKEEKQEEEPTEKPTEKEDSRKNLVNITDFEVIYSGEFYIEDFDDYFEWGVCSYKREDEKKSVTVFYFKYGETDENEYLFVSDEIDKDTNTVIFDLTNKNGRQVTIAKNVTDGVEFDQTVNYSYNYEIQVNVAENMKAESVVVSYKHKTENKFTDEIIDMEDYEESGKLPSDLFDRKSNVEVTNKPVEKTEEKKEEVKSQETEFDVNEWIEDIVDEMTEKSYITVGATSKKYYFGHEFTFNKENLDNQKETAEKFLKKIFAMSGMKAYDEEHDCREESYDHVFRCSIYVSDAAFDNYDIVIQDEHMKFLGECYYVKNTSEILEYAVGLWDEDFKVFECESRRDLKEPDDYTGKIDFENSQFVRDNGTTKDFKYREKIEFDIKLDKSFEETIFEKYASTYEEVHCTIQNLWSGSMFFVLTIEGSKGTGQYWANVRSSSLGGGFSGSETGRVLRFLTVNKVDDDVMKVYDRMPMEQYATIEVQGSLENDDVAGVSIQWKPYQLSSNNAVANINPSNSLEGYNIDYEYYGTEEELKNGRNMYTLFGIEEKDIEIQKDVAEFKTFEEKANALKEMGLFKGTDKGYELEKILTREESAVILVRLAGGEEKLSDNDYEEKFLDVPQSEWSFDYVMFCYENGITKGTGETTFSPDDMISADQFVTLILRLLGYTDANPDTALDRAVNMGIIDEYDAKRYEQSSIFTRGDAVYIMYNCLEAETADGKLFKDVLVI